MLKFELLLHHVVRLVAPFFLDTSIERRQLVDTLSYLISINIATSVCASSVDGIT